MVGVVVVVILEMKMLLAPLGQKYKSWQEEEELREKTSIAMVRLVDLDLSSVRTSGHSAGLVRTMLVALCGFAGDGWTVLV